MQASSSSGPQQEMVPSGINGLSKLQEFDRNSARCVTAQGAGAQKRKSGPRRHSSATRNTADRAGTPFCLLLCAALSKLTS